MDIEEMDEDFQHSMKQRGDLQDTVVAFTYMRRLIMNKWPKVAIIVRNWNGWKDMSEYLQERKC